MFLKKLKMILNYNITYFFLIVSLFIITLYKVNNEFNKCSYVLNDNYFNVIVNDFSFSEDKVTFKLNGQEKLIGNLYFTSDKEKEYLLNNIMYGSKLKIKGVAKEVFNNTIPNTFNYKKYLEYNDIYYLVEIDDIDINNDNISFLYKVKNFINSRINKIDSKGYLKAFILGDKSNINGDMYSNYQDIGVSHLFALSGMHIGLFSTILLLFFRKFSDKFKYLFVDVILVGYGFIVGFPSSIKRCLGFFIINSINKVFKLEISSLKCFLLVIIFLILFNYKIIFDVGFLYSLCTVFGIIYFNNFISDNSVIKSSIKLSFIAFLFSAPISLYAFYKVNFLSIIYNIFYIPFVSIIVYPLALFSFVFNPLLFIFDFFINILELVSSFLCKIDILVIIMKFNVIDIVIYYFLIIFSLNKKSFKLFLLFILYFIFVLKKPILDSNLYVYYFDVGQGDSSLIITPNRNEVIMIDTGGIVSYNDNKYMVSDNVLTFFNSIGIKKIDYLILTHGDYDHMGEVKNILDNIKVDNVIFNNDEFNTLEKENVNLLTNYKINILKGMDKIVLKKFTIYFLNNELFDNENDNSNVLYFSFDNYKFLFMGDAGITREKDILDKYNLSDIDFIKIGHHGSNTSSSEYFISSIKPKNCMISVGKNNRYGHPKDDVLDTLDDYCDIYRTDLNGSVEIKINKNGYKIKTYSP